MQSLDGTATLNGHDGAISGLNVEQLLRRLERRPLSGAGSFRSGSTPYNNLTVALKFADGVATTENVKLEGPAANVSVNGTITVPNREFDLKGTASLVSNGTSSFDLPFVVQGPWDDPLIYPEADSLIKRSTVTGPLLDALKDRSTRDAVRSVLERLTGQKQPDQDAAPAAAADPPAK
jgi:AsmA protein